MSVTPDITVAAIAERDGKFLIVEERTKSGRLVLNQPAGHVEPGESLTDAVVRETREETGWDFLPVAVCGVYFWQHPSNGSNVLRFSFCGELVRVHDGPLDPDIVRTQWLTRRELEAEAPRLRSDMVLLAVDDYLAGRRHPVDLVRHLAPVDRPR